MTDSPERRDASAIATRDTKPGYHPVADAPHHLRHTDREPRAAKRADPLTKVVAISTQAG